MRFINNASLEGTVDAAWHVAAQEALDSVRACPPHARLTEINARSAVWTALKPNLENLSYRKCWYCESIQDRADNAIDHFRPKAGKQHQHGGYWWLAFSWNNFRYACTYCNSRRRDARRNRTGGKQNSFPLGAGGTRAVAEGDNLELEWPLLLDPTNALDPTLLWFEPDGRVTPRYTEAQNRTLNEKARVSIDLYHLDYFKTKERREILYNEIRQLVTDGSRFMLRATDDHDVRYALEQVMERLIGFIQPKAEFSAAARAFMLSFRDHPWVETILSTC